MNPLLTLEENTAIAKWQKEFRKIVKEQNKYIKVRVEKETKSNEGVNKANTHKMILTHHNYDSIQQHKQKISTCFTFDYPFLFCNYTTVDNYKYYTLFTTKAKLLNLSLKYWLEVARLVGAKIVVWKDYHRESLVLGTLPLSKEEMKVVRDFHFEILLSENEFDDVILQGNTDVDNYIIELEEGYRNYTNSIVASIRSEVTNHIKKRPTSFIQNRGYQNNQHYFLSFYHEGEYGQITVNFNQNGFKIEEDGVQFPKVIQSVDEIPSIIDKTFSEFHEKNRLKNLIKPPRLHTEEKLCQVFQVDRESNILGGAGEDVYDFLARTYSPEKLEEWSVNADTKFSYVSENDIYLFNFCDYLFITKGTWYEIFPIKEKEKAYNLYKEKFIEDYILKAMSSLKRFENDLEL